MKIFKLILVFFIFVLANCTSTEEIHVAYQVTGAVKTNCYLLFGDKSKEAALIDVGGPIDTLLEIIEEKDLSLKYFLFTHSHFDLHVNCFAHQFFLLFDIIAHHRKIKHY